MKDPMTDRIGNHALCSQVARRLEDFDIDGPFNPDEPKDREKLNALWDNFQEVERRVRKAMNTLKLAQQNPPAHSPLIAAACRR